MANQANAYSGLPAQVNFPDVADITCENLYHFLDCDIREAIKAYDLSLEAVRANILAELLIDMFEDGSRSYEIHDLVRDTFTAWKRAHARVERGE